MVGVVTHVSGRGVLDPTLRGYQVLFRANEANYCPGCGRAQWYVGRVTAECVFCGTALPLAEAHWGESGTTWSHAGAPVARRLAEEQFDPAERRRQHRKPENRIVQLLIDGLPQSFGVYNLSEGGVMIESSAELIKARRVHVIAPDGEIVGATVRWADGARSGLQFSKRLTDVALLGASAA